LSFYTELKRRNVFKVAIVYSAVAWLLLQVSDTLGPALHLPEWFVSAVAFLLILGFPVSIIFAWAFDLTPEGLKREVLVLALSYFVFDKVALDSGRDAAGISTTGQVAQQRPAEIESAKTDNSIAVLPFVNMSSDEEQEYFSDGLSEELLNLLARIPELNVAARTSSFSFKDKDLEIPEIASRLKVAHVLEGSVRKHGNQLRITAQLIQADNGYHLWSETYDRQLDNVFQIQEDIASAVVDALRITLLGEAPKTRKTDPAAYQLFLEGQYLKRQISMDSLNRAIQAFKQAVEIDPAYVPAWAELADTYLWGGGLDELSHEETSKCPCRSGHSNRY
jgi:TolB-like protein